MHRADDDAHTLTMVSQPTTGWAMLPGELGAGAALRVEVSRDELPVVTLTF
jgi:hypothetical protein